MVGKSDGIDLGEICNAPLRSNFRPASISDCVIQSVWGYFQDSVEIFNQTDDIDGFEVSAWIMSPSCQTHSFASFDR